MSGIFMMIAEPSRIANDLFDQETAERFDLTESVERCNSIAELVFMDCKENGFSQSLATGYNILISARHYLQTGETMIGNRTEEFFKEEQIKEEDEMERARR